MGPIEKDLQAKKEDIRGNKWDWNNYLGFNMDHGAPIYEGTKNDENTLLALLDELEEEHKTEIPQPVDADGVPWTGEEAEFIDGYGKKHDIERMYYNLANKEWFLKCREKYVKIASHCRHVKPKRTLKEIARDIVKAEMPSQELCELIEELSEAVADDSSDKS